MSVLVSDIFLFSFWLKYELQLRNRDIRGGIFELGSAVDKLECGFDGEEQGGPVGHSQQVGLRAPNPPCSFLNLPMKPAPLNAGVLTPHVGLYGLAEEGQGSISVRIAGSLA
jgi:hypothetical protein